MSLNTPLHEDDEDAICCDICYEMFDDQDHSPFTICENGHTACMCCARKAARCFICRESILEKLIPNRDVLNILEAINNSGHQIPFIPYDDLHVENTPFMTDNTGEFRECTWKTTNMILKVYKELTEAGKLRLMQEIKRTLNFNFPNVIRAFGTTTLPSGQIGLIIEHCDGSLSDLIPSETSVENIKLARQVVAAVEYLHNAKMCHYNLTPGKILLSHGVCKIADFGTSKIIEEHTTMPSTQFNEALRYAPIELMENRKEGPKTDVYSVGIVLFELLCGKHAFGKKIQLMMKDKMQSAPLPFPNDCHAQLREILQRCASADPHMRPQLHEIDQVLHSMLDVSVSGVDREKEQLRAEVRTLRNDIEQFRTNETKLRQQLLQEKQRYTCLEQRFKEKMDNFASLSRKFGRLCEGL
ncbi:hypothetical protein P9112_004291 [Eukaryota sp. TZLM1-RC]